MRVVILQTVTDPVYFSKEIVKSYGSVLMNIISESKVIAINSPMQFFAGSRD